MLKASDGRILFLIKALVALAFLAKVSLRAFLPIPREVAYLVFQQGMHPYVNVILSALFGGPLILLWLKVRDRQHLSGFYKLFVFTLMLVLLVQSLLQIHYVNAEESPLMQVGAVLVSLFMITVYGLVIPSLWPVEDFLRFVQRWSGALVVISLLLLPVAGGAVFKGGRFIGVFKHIPHMVTCATVAYIFSLGTILTDQKLQHKIWDVVVLLASFLAIILTGTRSSAGAAVVAFILAMILHQAESNKGRIFKFATSCFIVTFTSFFGMQTYEFAHGIAIGENSLGSRQAQDGIASRMEEIQRGFEIFMEQPWLGHGLMSKFASGNEVDVSNYNAMKDPHNIFISAGVIGGWPLLFLSGIAVLFMTLGSCKALKSLDVAKRAIAIYLLSHIPILLIYHIHLSIGGMADRIYWLVFGVLAAAITMPQLSEN